MLARTGAVDRLNVSRVETVLAVGAVLPSLECSGMPIPSSSTATAPHAIPGCVTRLPHVGNTTDCTSALLFGLGLGHLFGLGLGLGHLFGLGLGHLFGLGLGLGNLFGLGRGQCCLEIPQVASRALESLLITRILGAPLDQSQDRVVRVLGVLHLLEESSDRCHGVEGVSKGCRRGVEGVCVKRVCSSVFVSLCCCFILL